MWWHFSGDIVVFQNLIIVLLLANKFCSFFCKHYYWSCKICVSYVYTFLIIQMHDSCWTIMSTLMITSEKYRRKSIEIFLLSMLTLFTRRLVCRRESYLRIHGNWICKLSHRKMSTFLDETSAFFSHFDNLTASNLEYFLLKVSWNRKPWNFCKFYLKKVCEYK